VEPTGFLFQITKHAQDSSSDEHKNDFETLDYILRVNGSNESYRHANRVNANSEAIPVDKADEDVKFGNDIILLMKKYLMKGVHELLVPNER